MANIANHIVQGGLGLQAAQDYDEKQSARSHAQRAREYGVKQMNYGERRMAAEDSLLDKDTETKRLRQSYDQNEAIFAQQNQGADQALRSGDLRHRQAMQPGQQRLATIQQGINTSQAETQQKLLPGQAKIDEETQSVQMQTLREQQAGNVWSLYKLGDKKGALELLNNSQLLHPGRKFSAIQPGGAPARGDDGRPAVGADGKPVVEELIRLVAADGGEDVIVPRKRLEENAEKHKPIKERELTEKVRHNKATEGIQRQLADVRAQRGTEAATALERNVMFLVKNGIAKDAVEGFAKLRTAMEKPEEDAILSVAGNLMKGPRYMGKDGWNRAVKDATTMVQTVKGGKPEASAPAGGTSAPGSGAPGAAAGGRTYSAGGKTFTDADLESTARTYGITTDQVKARLGIR